MNKVFEKIKIIFLSEILTQNITIKKININDNHLLIFLSNVKLKQIEFDITLKEKSYSFSIWRVGKRKFSHIKQDTIYFKTHQELTDFIKKDIIPFLS